MKKMILFFTLSFLTIGTVGFCGLTQVYNQTLTAVGSTAFIDTTEVSDHTFYVTVSGVSTNVVYRFEGSLDGTTTCNIDDIQSTFTITSNGVYQYRKDNFSIPLVRLTWVSSSGAGTTPNVKLNYFGKRGTK